ISLLSTSPEAAVPAPVVTEPSGRFSGPAPDDEPSLTPNEQGGALARLFGRRPFALPNPDDDRLTIDGDDDPFAAMLRESVEDQDLRQRLAKGFAGKVAL